MSIARLEKLCLSVAVVSRVSRITYGEAAAHLGIHHRAMRPLLLDMNRFRDARGLPDLSCVVVNQKTEEVGQGWYYDAKRAHPEAARHRAHLHALSVRSEDVGAS